MERFICSNDATRGAKESFLNFTADDWLWENFSCCGSNLQRCAKVTRIDSHAGPPAPSERPLIRRPKKAVPRSPEQSRESQPLQAVPTSLSPGRSPGFLTQGICTADVSSSLPLMERPSPSRHSKFVGETGGLAKPMAACHESESPPYIDWTSTFPPLPSVQSEDPIRVESLHLISDTLVEPDEEPDESPEVSENELKKPDVPGRTRVLMASDDVGEHRERKCKSQQDCLTRIQAWFEKCGLENTSVAADTRQFGESAMSFAECCQPGDTCALILSGIFAEVPEEERTEVAGTPILSSFFQALPLGTTVVILADSDRAFTGMDFEAAMDREVKLLVFALTFSEEVSTQSRSALCNLAMLQAADALSLADGPCKLTCLDFFQEMIEQAEDLASDWGLAQPKPFLRGMPDDSLPSSTRWPLSRAPRELAREIGANNTAATQTWIRTGAVPRALPEALSTLSVNGLGYLGTLHCVHGLHGLQCAQCIPELHRPRPRSESPPRERQAAAEQLAAAGASIASAALAATAAAVVEAGSATVSALVDVQHSRNLARQHSRSLGVQHSRSLGHQGCTQMHKSLSSEGLRDTSVADTGRSSEEQKIQVERAERAERGRRQSGTDKAVKAAPANRSLRSMPNSFGSLELMLSGGGVLKKPSLKRSTTAR